MKKMKKYLIEQRERNDGVQKIYEFPNGYGASVICNPYSYGGEMGLWELAVLDKDGEPTFETPITDDVIGHLNDDEVIEVLNKIKELENIETNDEIQLVRYAVRMARELVERDTPKKPIVNVLNGIREYNCGVCVCSFDIPQLKELNFCPKCGQRIDWKE